MINNCYQYLKRKSLRQKPTAHISYHEGINLIREFLNYASHHTVEDIQGFTSQWVPIPRWIKVDEVNIPDNAIEQAVGAICAQLGHKGVDLIGGKKWWQWRKDGDQLRSEFIEMRRDYNKQKASGQSAKRVMLYVHGGAYFFGSVDAHRYQLQRHARKLEARVFAPRYRLSPQFPFPCGLLDCLATYIYLITVQQPSEIVFAGDSAGAGMVLSLLVILRDQHLPLPAGAILISPWVDLTHSFPSVTSDGSFDYIPAHGFMQRPSASWPPPNAEDMKQIAMHAVEEVVDHEMPRKSTQIDIKHAEQAATQGFIEKDASDSRHPETNGKSLSGQAGVTRPAVDDTPGPGHDLSIMVDGKLIEIKDQIQMYTTNQLISHPLVSPVLQPSLGGLPPLLILTGGGEVLRDEQIYLAHKAANPSKYPPSEATLGVYSDAVDIVGKYGPTDVQLQVWDDLCHVAPTLSFTRPAKYMFRSIAQFGAWALARAQNTAIDIQDDDDMSIISSESESEERGDESRDGKAKEIAGATPRIDKTSKGQVGKAGDPLPPFKNHMIRQRVDRNGGIFPLGQASSIPALQLSPNEIGVIKPGPVAKWMTAKKEWDSKYLKEKRKVQKQRIKEMAEGYRTFGNDEVPPPSALAGRRDMHSMKEEKKGRSWGMSIWSLWGSSHDEQTMEREEKAEKGVETAVVEHTEKVSTESPEVEQAKTTRDQSRSKSRRRAVTDLGQTRGDVDENTPAAVLETLRTTAEPPNSGPASPRLDLLSIPTVHTRSQSQEGDEGLGHSSATKTSNRPAAGPARGFPFKLSSQITDDGRNASTFTLESHMDVAGGVASSQTEGGSN